MERINLPKLAVALMVITVCCSVSMAQGDVRLNSSEADEQAIRNIVKQMETGWNKKSGSVFAKPFAANADYVVISGMHISGHAEIAKRHQQIFDTIYMDSILTLFAKQVRLLRPDVALVHVSGQLKNKTAAEVRTSDVTISLVMTKDQGEWKIAGFQNTAVDKRR